MLVFRTSIVHLYAFSSFLSFLLMHAPSVALFSGALHRSSLRLIEIHIVQLCVSSVEYSICTFWAALWMDFISGALSMHGSSSSSASQNADVSLLCKTPGAWVSFPVLQIRKAFRQKAGETAGQSKIDYAWLVCISRLSTNGLSKPDFFWLLVW